MLAILLAPVYLFVCIYVLNWILKWMAACHFFPGFVPFQYTFITLYMLAATTLLTSFLIKKPGWLHRTLKQISNAWLGTFTYALIGIGIIDLIRILIHISRFPFPGYHSSALFIATGTVIGSVILSTTIYGSRHAKKLHITPYQVTLDKTCGSRKKMDIVLIADLHLGYSVGEKQLRKMTRWINTMHADLVLIAGDIFDNDFNAIKNPDQCAEILRSIKSTCGTWCCYGNHDLDEAILAGFTFGGEKQGNDARFEQFFQKSGITLLNDETVLIDDSFYLIGRRDADRCKKLASENGRLTPAQLTENLDITKPIFVMDHQPSELSGLSDAGVDLDLCGHTHGGQLFPCNLTLPLIWENPYGLLKKGNMYNIVTSGIGVWGPNMRIGSKGEICRIRVYFRQNKKI